MTKVIVKKDTAQIHEGKNKPDRSSCLISKSKNAPALNILNDELMIERLEGSNFLELLPQEIVVNILTKLGHCDLKHILLVSKPINEAAIVARETHFLFSTPSKKPVFRTVLEPGDSEAPNAPKATKKRRAKQQKARTSRPNAKKLTSLRVVLFRSSKGS